MRFFFDNCVSPFLAHAIRALEEGQSRHHVEPLRQRFDPDTPDVVWIKALGSEEHRWTVVSGDLRISRNEAERKAWKESGLTIFFLQPSWADQTAWIYSSRLVLWWPRIVAEALTSPKQRGLIVPFKGQKFEEMRL